MEMPTETCTPDIKKNINLRHYFFLRQFGSFRCNRFVLLFFYANVTVLMVRTKDDRFLQVVAEHVTIIWPVLFWSLDDLFRWKHTTTFYFMESFSNSFLSHPCKKIQVYACSEKQKGNSKLKEIASNQPLLLHAGFFGVTCVFPISYEHFMHVGMLQSRYRQCTTGWLLSTWSDYVRYFAWSLFAISTT